jgi:hypothetical protein
VAQALASQPNVANPQTADRHAGAELL